MSEIKLTLNPTPAAPAAPAVSADSTAVAPVAQEAPAAPEAIQEPQFTPEEQAQIDEFAKQIDVTDTNLVFSYGANAQQGIAEFSDTALQNVKTKDLDEVGDMIASLVGELKGFSSDEEEKKGIFGWFKHQVDKVELLKTRYDAAEANVNKICEGLENHQVQLLKDIAMLDRLYEQNLTYFKELSMYIAAGKKRLEEVRATDLKAAYDKAEKSGLPEDAQAAKDMNEKCERFEKKLYDLELTRNVSIQMAPQIRLIQSSNQLMAEKIQTSLNNTIPLWKSQMVLALGLAHTQSAMEAQRAVSDLTNELLLKNAEKLKMATTESAKEAERGIVDIETLQQTNQMLIDTMDEVLTIQQEGRQKRQAAEGQLKIIENDLRNKLLELRK